MYPSFYRDSNEEQLSHPLKKEIEKNHLSKKTNESIAWLKKKPC